MIKNIPGRLTYLPTDNEELLEAIKLEINNIYGIKICDSDLLNISLLSTLIQVREKSNRVIEGNILLLASLQARADKESMQNIDRISKLLKEV